MKQRHGKNAGVMYLWLTIIGLIVPVSMARAALTDSTQTYTLFESGQVRPLAMSPNNQRLFAVNTPDNRLEVFRVKKNRLIHTASIPVGLEPVAVAARTNREVWVVNHLSDSVSVVELDDGATSGHVERTLLVGDEPRDIVFAGPGRRRAFITTAHRGQNIPFDPKVTVAGVGRADVWVFEAGALGNALGGAPLTIVTLFTDTPRALAVTRDGTRVYAAGFHTGNQTTTISEAVLPDGFGPDGAPTAELENDTFVPSAASHIPVSGGGPTGLVLDEQRGQIVCVDALRRRDLDHRHDDPGGDGARDDAQPGAAERRGRRYWSMSTRALRAGGGSAARDRRARSGSRRSASPCRSAKCMPMCWRIWAIEPWRDAALRGCEKTVASEGRSRRIPRTG